MPAKIRLNKKSAIVVCTISIILFLLLIYAVVIEPGQLVIQNQSISLPRWSPQLNHLKVVVISDLHVGCLSVPISKLRRVIAAANQQNPDVIVMLGDFVTGHGGKTSLKPEEFVHELSALKAKHGVYTVLGNHDWWYNGDAVRAELEKANIHVLENDASEVKINGSSLWIAGLADQWTRVPDIPRTMSRFPVGAPSLMLMHEPDFFRDIPESVSLSLAGHTHGGQVSLPFIGPPIVPSTLGGKFARGLVVENNRHYFVTSGVGTSILPVRFGVPPEICVLDLSAQESAH